MGMNKPTTTIGKITKWLSGGTPSRSIVAYWEGDIPWISAATMKRSEISESNQHVTSDAVARGSKMAPVNATLLLVRGSALYNEIRAGLVVSPVCFNQDVKALVPDSGVEPKFLTYSLLGREQDLLKLVSSAGNSAGVLDTKLVQSFEIYFPEPAEQRAIAVVLSDVDGLLGSLEKLIAKKRDIKQAAMEQLLTGKIRPPGFTGKWETKQIGEVAEIHSGATPSTQIAAFWNGTIPWCTPTDITGTTGKYISTTERTITEVGLTACAASLLPPATLLLCSRATIGEVKIATTNICTNQGFKSLVCRPGNSNEFMYYIVLTLKPQLVERAIGSTFLEIGKRDLASIPIKMPQEEEQSANAKVLCDMDSEMLALERRRDKTRQIKQGMMQQLLTGRIRLVKPGTMASEKAMTQKTGARRANIHFMRSVLAAEIIDELHEQPTFGHVKFEKVMYLAEQLCDV